MKHVIKRSILGVLVVLIIAAVVLVFCLDGIIRRTVQSQATTSLKLQTTLDKASISLVGGHVSLAGLSIGSPEGFAAPEMFALKEVAVTVSYSQLTGQPIHISQIVVDGPRLVVEQKNGQLNVKAAMDAMPKGESSTMRLIIDDLQVKDTTVVFRPGLPLLKPEYTFVLPSISLKNVGNGDGANNGAAIKDVVKLVLASLTQKMQESGQLQLPGLGSLLSMNGQQLQTAANQQVQKQLDAVKGQADSAIQKNLGDLLKGSKK